MTTAPLISPMQIITLALFLGLLGLLWLYVQRHKSGLARRMGQGRRIALAEVMALSPTDRAMILTVDGQDYLVLRARGCAPVITPLAARHTPEVTA